MMVKLLELFPGRTVSGSARDRIGGEPGPLSAFNGRSEVTHPGRGAGCAVNHVSGGARLTCESVQRPKRRAGQSARAVTWEQFTEAVPQFAEDVEIFIVLPAENFVEKGDGVLCLPLVPTGTPAVILSKFFGFARKLRAGDDWKAWLR